MSEHGRISAIVPTCNGAGFVADTLRSIAGQTQPVHEIVVVDDGSTDDTLDIVRAVCPEAIILRGHAHEGASAARARGVAASVGNWLAFCDHDDVWPSNRNAALVAAAADAVWISGRVRMRFEPGFEPTARLAAADGTHIPYLLSSTLMRRSVWERSGGLNAGLKVGEDVDFFLRFKETGGVPILIDDFTLEHRIHPGGMVATRESTAAQETFDVIRAAVARRRQGRVPPESA